MSAENGLKKSLTPAQTALGIGAAVLVGAIALAVLMLMTGGRSSRAGAAPAPVEIPAVVQEDGREAAVPVPAIQADGARTHAADVSEEALMNMRHGAAHGTP